MGRGRAKAKQTKVARELKYSSPATDFDSLQRELSGDSTSSHRSGVRSGDPYETPRWDDDDEDDWRSAR
ncbi:DUF3073 domain-containing protein [Skermania piniformis]|uniref:DUF3073 domain-containing protein n=1 Tax=Skermania pinensis TaxID=39122 RepID=A0ABX8SCP9_9ACTN|nr:DUF3073 domain-containing protein [Skermania piniformis]QXQ13471.1 DUF3073 domain-containing protein [Skermania piniformis]